MKVQFDKLASITHVEALVELPRELYETNEDITFQLGDAIRITIPKGYVTDLGSILRSLQWFYSPTGRGQEAFILHDWLYDTQMVERRIADALMSSALKARKTDFVRRFLMYLAVRIGGPRYNTYTPLKDLALLRALKIRGLRGQPGETTFIDEWRKTNTINK